MHVELLHIDRITKFTILFHLTGFDFKVSRLGITRMTQSYGFFL
jgi:hypothetical protein